jgi:hypothetical protein
LDAKNSLELQYIRHDAGVDQAAGCVLADHCRHGNHGRSKCVAGMLMFILIRWPNCRCGQLCISIKKIAVLERKVGL